MPRPLKSTTSGVAGRKKPTTKPPRARRAKDSATQLPAVRDSDELETRKPLQVQATGTKKLILVDALNFWHPNSRRDLNLGTANWKKFADILKDEVGTGEPLAPIYVVHLDTPPHRVAHLKRKGFDVVTLEIPAGSQEDDKYLLGLIDGIDPKEVGSLVLVTRDGGFIEAVERVKARGIVVWWVATNGTPFGLGMETEARVKEEFNYVDLRAIADRIRLAPWEERSTRFQRPPAPVPQPVEKKTAVFFRAEVPTGELTTLMAMLQPAIDRFKLQVSIG